MANVVNWFEIPAVDIDRACAFYAAVIGASFERSKENPNNAMFSLEGDGVGGEISVEPNHAPGCDGVLIYLNAPNGVADALARVEASGGKIDMDRTAIGPHGYIAVVIDTEGNRVGLHNMRG